MAKKKDSFYIQEIMPYLPESEMAHIGRYLPQGIQEKKAKKSGHSCRVMDVLTKDVTSFTK